MNVWGLAFVIEKPGYEMRENFEGSVYFLVTSDISLGKLGENRRAS